LAILRDRQISILHCHCYKSDLYGLILSRFHPMKLVTTAHGPLASFRFFWSAKNWRVRYIYDQLDLRLLRHFDTVIMVSDTMRPIISRYGVDDRKLIWIRNAIDSRFFRRTGPTDPSLRSSLGISNNAPIIGAVGRLNGEKDYPNFLNAAKILVAQNPDLRFVIAGKGELDQQLRHLTRELGLAEHVRFLGHLHDVRKVYELMDVYALSSTREGLPNAVLEAMAMEVPIVATDVDGVKEAVVNDSEAILVAPRDAQSLAKGIQRVLDDSSLAQRLARAARRKVELEFSFEARMRRVEAIYRSVVGQ
jgi:glycosyltransferase involved in cell wall biosynthesis